MNALFNAVTNEEFEKISSIETAKEAMTILQTTYEGTKDVKDSKLQRLTTSFEEIKMEESIPKPKIVRKVLRFLLGRFHAKITMIEESKDINKIPLT